jgi:hypothetical protein
MEHRLMTEYEKADIAMEAERLRAAGRKEEALALDKTIPVPPFWAKYWKDAEGADFLIRGGWNLKEAEAEYGPGWLDN